MDMANAIQPMGDRMDDNHAYNLGYESAERGETAQDAKAVEKTMTKGNIDAFWNGWNDFYDRGER